MSQLDHAIGELVIANRILANEGVVDAYGHVSIRHPANRDRYLLSRSRSPELVTQDDIMTFSLESMVTGEDKRRQRGETGASSFGLPFVRPLGLMEGGVGAPGRGRPHVRDRRGLRAHRGQSRGEHCGISGTVIGRVRKYGGVPGGPQTRRIPSSSVAPIPSGIGVPCVLGLLGLRTANHDRTSGRVH